MAEQQPGTEAQPPQLDEELAPVRAAVLGQAPAIVAQQLDEAAHAAELLRELRRARLLSVRAAGARCGLQRMITGSVPSG